MVAGWDAEEHSLHPPRTRLPVVALEMTSALPDDPTRQVVWVEIVPHKRPDVCLLGTKVSSDGRLLWPYRGKIRSTPSTHPELALHTLEVRLRREPR
jgi:hypothetical protein